MGAQIPVMTEKPLVVCGCRKFQVDTLCDHLCTCTVHSGVKKAHHWVVDHRPNLFSVSVSHKTNMERIDVLPKQGIQFNQHAYLGEKKTFFL